MTAAADPVRDGRPDGRMLVMTAAQLHITGDEQADALLGTRHGVAPDGWRDAAGSYGEQG